MYINIMLKVAKSGPASFFFFDYGKKNINLMQEKLNIYLSFVTYFLWNLSRNYITFRVLFHRHNMEKTAIDVMKIQVDKNLSYFVF